MAGTLAARPAAHPYNAGMLYLATDGGGGALYRSDGSAWAPCSATAQSGSVTLDANFNVTAANDTWQAVRTTTPAADLAVTLPAAGTYLLAAVVRAAVYFTAGANGSVSTRFFNVTDGAAVAGLLTLAVLEPATNVLNQTTVTPLALVAVAAPKVLRLEALRSGGTTWVNSVLVSDVNGQTSLAYVRLS
jgi:hypothetical protein